MGGIQELEKETPVFQNDKFHFKYLPDYAAYLLNNKLEEMVRVQLRDSYDLDIPLMKLFSNLGHEEIFQLSLKGTTDFLKIIIDNKLSQYIQETMKKWKDNQLPMITKNQFVVEDITKGNYLRRKIYLQFLSGYTNDMEVFTGVLNELDFFIMQTETESFKMIELIRNEELNKNLRFIEKIVQTVPSTVFVFDIMKKKEVFTNVIAKNFLGYSREEFNDTDESILFDIIHPDDLSALLEKFNSFSDMKETDVFIFENRAKHKSGEYKWLRNYTRAFKMNENGTPIEIIVASLDVTEEKRISEESHHHEKQLLEAQEISNMGSFIWDLTGNGHSNYTPQVYRIFELDQLNDMKKFFDAIHPADKAKVEDAMQKAFTNEDGLYECEYRYLKNGKEKIIWSRGIVAFENKKPVSMQGTIMDVTDKHHMVKKLQRSEELYKQAQAISHIGNWSWDLALNSFEWSDEIYRIHEMTPGEKLNQEELNNLIHPDDKEKMRIQLQKTLESIAPYDYQYRIILASGTMKALRVKGEALRDKNGVPYKKVGTVQDITSEYLLNLGLKEREENLKQLLIKIEQTNRELERSNQELTNFNYIASHDLQEPLRKINTFTNRILEKEEGNLSDSGKNYFNRIQYSTNRMQRLLDDLLEFSRTHSSKKHIEKVNLTEVIKDLSEELKEAIEENSVILQLGTFPEITGIKFQLHQLFNNLIRNAIKYKRPEVVPVISITSIKIKGIETLFSGMENNKEYWKISITDNGIGFEPRYAEKIFEIFQRLHGKNEYDGTGIGLAICKKIMENHNGFINATGEINNGAEFNLYFPL